ncbi:MAG: transglutaminase family protein [Phycisphaerae bacterium]|jgi:transglutaminase-like putative cysteine protease
MLHHRCCVLAVTIAGVLLAGVACGQEFISNGNFDKDAAGWDNQPRDQAGVVSEWLATGGRDGSGGIHITSSRSGRGAIWVWQYTIYPLPAGKSLRVAGWVKGRNVQDLAGICVEGWNATRSRMPDFATTQTSRPLAGDFDWTEIETRLTPTAGTAQVHVLIFLSGTGEVWFDDVSVTGEDDPQAAPATTQPLPGLYDVRSKYMVSASRKAPKTTFLVPLPLDYREQVPLTYELWTKPAEKLAAARIYQDQPGNYVAEVVLKPMALLERIELGWRSIVLCGPRSFEDVPAKAPIPAEWPEAVRPWLRGSLCVQSDDERIREVARDIRGDRTDVLEIVSRTLDRARQIYDAQEGRSLNLDAVQALDKRGSCTSCANLVAALFRANNIPARVLAGYGTWAGPHQTHYIVEVYVPEYGWYPIESTKLHAPWQPYQQVQVSIVRPEYEDRSAFRAIIAAGVPYLSLTEMPDYDGSVGPLGIVSGKRWGCDHVAERWQAFPAKTTTGDWESLIKAGRDRWQAWLASPPTLDEKRRLATPLTATAVETNDPAALLRTLRE